MDVPPPAPDFSPRKENEEEKSNKPDEDATVTEDVEKNGDEKKTEEVEMKEVEEKEEGETKETESVEETKENDVQNGGIVFSMPLITITFLNYIIFIISVYEIIFKLVQCVIVTVYKR